MKNSGLKIGLILVLAFSIRLSMIKHWPQPHGYTFATLLHIDTAQNVLKGQGFVYGADLRKNREYGQKAAGLRDAGLPWTNMNLYRDPLKPQELEPYPARSPGYVLMLALNFSLFGSDNILSMRILQIIFDCLAVLLIFALGKELFNEEIGLLAAILAATFVPSAVHSASSLAYDAFMPFFIALSLWLFSKTLKNLSWRGAASCGLSIGLGMSFRESAFLLVGIFTLGWLLRYQFRKAIPRLIVFLGVVYGAMLPWTIRNYQVYEHFHFFLPATGISLLDAIVEQDTQNRWGFRDEKGIFMGTNALGEKILGKNFRMSSPEHNKIMMKFALDIIKADPLWWFKGYLKRLEQHTINPWSEWNALAPEPHWVHFKAAGGTLGQYILNHPAPFAARILGKVHEIALFLLALYGIYITRRQWRQLFCLMATPIAFIGLYCVFIAQSRFILPGKLPFFLFASVALLELWRKFKLPKGEKTHL